MHTHSGSCVIWRGYFAAALSFGRGPTRQAPRLVHYSQKKPKALKIWDRGIQGRSNFDPLLFVRIVKVGMEAIVRMSRLWRSV